MKTKSRSEFTHSHYGAKYPWDEWIRVALGDDAVIVLEKGVDFDDEQNMRINAYNAARARNATVRTSFDRTTGELSLLFTRNP